MSYFKRFTDCCAGFALFSALMYLFTQFMAYTPKEEVSSLEKLKLFFSDAPTKDYKYYLPLIGLMALSLLVSLIFHRLPQVTFAVSLLPMLRLVSMYHSEKVYERPMLYFILGGLHIVGCLGECVRRDRIDRHRRSAFAVDLAGLLTAGFCLYLYRVAPTIATGDPYELSFFERKIYYGMADAPVLTFLWVTALLFAVLVLLRWLLRDLYYLDALLAIGPACYLIYLWYADRIPFHGDCIVTLAVIYAVARIIVMISCKPKNAYGFGS